MCASWTLGCAPSEDTGEVSKGQDTTKAAARGGDDSNANDAGREGASSGPARDSGASGVDANAGTRGEGSQDTSSTPPELVLDEKAAAALETLAWRQYRAGNYAEASSSFEVLSTYFNDAWKYPFNAACAASLGGDLERAFLFLRIARGRSPAAVLKKAEKDADLTALRASPHWQAWLDDDHKVESSPSSAGAPSDSPENAKPVPAADTNADATAKVGGEIRVLSLDASFRSSGTSDRPAGLVFDLDLELTGESASQINATALCKIGDDYVWGWSANADPRTGLVGSQNGKRLTQTALSVLTSARCPADLSLDACTVVVRRKDRTLQTPIAEFCTRGEGPATAGACTNHAATPKGANAEFEIRSVAIDATQRPISLDVCSTARAGSTAAPRMILLEASCKLKKGSFRDTTVVTHPLTDPPAGSVTREWDFFDLKSKPTSCRFRYLNFETEAPLPGTQTYCYDGASGAVAVCAQATAP